MMLTTLVAILLALSAPSLQAQGMAPAMRVPVGTAGTVESLALHIKLSGITKSQAPEVVEEHLILAVAGPYRYVGAAFAHEDFAVLHGYKRNGKGVFVLAYPIPLKREGPLAYRVIIDGVWTADPSNTRRTLDPSAGIELSLAEIPWLSDLRIGKYSILAGEGRSARFVYIAPPGELVTVCGTFDNWDPFIHEMFEISPGVYELELSLPPGPVYYAFYHRGELRSDPLNPSRATDPEGRIVSYLLVPPVD